jgi:hypothetical protein
MTNLSPAAQAVLNAALETDFEIDFTNLDATLKASMKTVAAAALRAVSEHGEFVILDDSEYGDFVVKVDFLRAIADELEAQP